MWLRNYFLRQKRKVKPAILIGVCFLDGASDLVAAEIP